ncbi:MAG: chaperone NapD [Desulfobulbaceae bacterium]|uniref:Chaperone NapD n=1 Tax=Candidatus Desulfobia pelagia TaxID=2841692 RepID=A0A8J6NEI3_9BACT|nr:chaperone NapD [Candidatus Desulfobia pelagia]
MPIGGFVINIDPGTYSEAINILTGMPHLEVHGSDKKGNIVAVIETDTTRKMQEIVNHLNGLECVLTVALTYINVEDERGRSISKAGRQVFRTFRDKEMSM